jgi:hypothetical protein
MLKRIRIRTRNGQRQRRMEGKEGKKKIKLMDNEKRI